MTSGRIPLTRKHVGKEIVLNSSGHRDKCFDPQVAIITSIYTSSNTISACHKILDVYKQNNYSGEDSCI